MSTATTATTAVTYTIDPAHSSAGFKIRHLMVAYIRGGFSGINGTVIVDAANPANTTIDASIDATTLHTHDVKRDQHVKAGDFLDVDKYPKITFVSKRVVPDGKNQWKITGDLTLRGVTKEITLEVESAPAEAKDPWGNLRSGAEASTVIKRSDFGLTFNAPLETGGLMLSDEVHLHLDVELIKKA
ncbi:MAG: YceI family protein [Bryobacterales bacterium]|nr:YceI family protein [Bryobacterales bacterium]